MSEQTKENGRKKLEVTPSARLRIGLLLCLLPCSLNLPQEFIRERKITIFKVHIKSNKLAL